LFAYVNGVLASNSCGWCMYNLAYLFLYPTFECTQQDDQGNWVAIPSDSDKCAPSYFCKNLDSVHWQIDYSSGTTLDNWVSKYDMVCSNLIPYFGMTFFTGFAISSIFVPSYSDLHGRKGIYVFSLLFNFLSLTTMLVLPATHSSLYILLGAFFVLGLSSAGRVSVGYCYFLEFQPKKLADTLGTTFNIIEGAIYILLTIWYAYISKNWFWTVALGASIALITLFNAFFFLPESPKWLYDKKEFEKSQEILTNMAKINGVTLKPDSCLRKPIGREQVNHLQSPNMKESSVDQEETKSTWEIIRASKQILVNMICMILVWVSASFCYYLISYQLKYIKGDIYVNGIVSSSSEIVAYGVSGVLMKLLGMKNNLVISYVLAILGMVCLITIPTQD
jgi:MFS family permease